MAVPDRVIKEDQNEREGGGLKYRQEPYPPTPEGVSFLLQIMTNSEVFKRHDLNTNVINMYTTPLLS
jgi:hypothetical protein